VGLLSWAMPAGPDSPRKWLVLLLVLLVLVAVCADV
jgi:MYXO-CTERM domain-containing protein